MLQIHEHQCPIEAARVEDGIDESGAIVQIGDVLLTEIALQLFALRFELGHLLTHFFRPSAQRIVDFAGRIDVPTQPEKQESRDDRGQTGTNQESPVGFQCLGC